MDTRAIFEEIWPVPEGVYWCADLGEYMRTDASNKFLLPVCVEYDARLDTFTRCQETTDLYLTLIDDLVYDLGRAYNHLKRGTSYNTHSLDRAKQILEKRK
jgi:hypothetical protein